MKRITIILLVLATILTATAIAEPARNNKTGIARAHDARIEQMLEQTEEEKPTEKTISDKMYEQMQKTEEELRQRGIIQALYETIFKANGYDALRENNIQSALDMFVEAYNNTDSYETRLNIENALGKKYNAILQEIFNKTYREYGYQNYLKVKKYLTDEKNKERIVSMWTDAYIDAQTRKLIEYKIAVAIVLRQEKLDQQKADQTIHEMLEKAIVDIIETDQTDEEKDIEDLINEYIKKNGASEFTSALLDFIEIEKYGRIIGE